MMGGAYTNSHDSVTSLVISINSSLQILAAEEAAIKQQLLSRALLPDQLQQAIARLQEDAFVRMLIAAHLVVACRSSIC